MQTNKPLQLAHDFVQYTGQHIFLTGKAGTGKTTFLHELKKKSLKRMIVVAPTGVAAINAGGITIHSFFQLSFGPQIGMENISPKQKRFSKEKINIIRSLDLLIIDEISMVRADILDAMDGVLRRFRDRNKAFGGVQLLMIGDLQQLSPIVKNEEWDLLKSKYDTVYFFSSKVLQGTRYVSIELSHVYRQQDDKFISILNKVRDNQLDKDARDTLNQRYIRDFKPDKEEGYITLCTHNARAHRINESELQELPAEIKVFNATTEGNFPEYSYPTDLELQLKTGAQVMFVKNDPSPEKLFYNGKIGKITHIGDDAVYVLCSGDDDEIEVTPLLWENIKYTIDQETSEIKETVEGSFIQLPLKLAWAITIHKSQGLTFEKAIIDAEASFAHGQVYVALSRCKTLEGMVLSTPISGRSIINDNTVNGFIQEVEKNQPGSKELNDARLNYQKDLLMDMFRFDNIQMLVNSMNKIFRENTSAVPEVLIEYFKQIQTEFRREIREVAEKFQTRINRYLLLEPDVEQNMELQERILKASVYFSDKVNTVLVEKLDRADLEVDNKALRKQISSLASRLSGELKLKVSLFDACKDGFEVKKILNTRAKAVIEKARPRKQLKSAKIKEVLDPESIPHPELYQELRSYRIEKASDLGVPAYMVFSQKALIELVNYLPVDTQTLQQINGLGSKKISQFGTEIIEIIDAYCLDNDVERMEIPLKTGSKRKRSTDEPKKPKEDTKKISYELFKSGKTVLEIAEARGMAPTTIEAHLAHFVAKGELDVSLFLPEGKLKKIKEYFKKAETNNLGPAKAALGDDFSYGDLRFGLNHLFYLLKKIDNN
jgi:DNA polymerase III delta prime subunit